MRTLSALTSVAVGMLLAAPVHAQSVSDVLRFLVTNQSVATGSPERDRAAAQMATDAISHALLASLATLPVSTSSGAFVYRLNPTLGTIERATESFGPFLVERAITASGRTASFALTYQHLRFTSLDGRNLRDGSLVTTANRFLDEAAPFDVDRLTLEMTADVATLHASVGVGDRLEVGTAIPVVALHVSGSRVDTYRSVQYTQAVASSRVVGLADAAIRAKYALYSGRTGALAAGVEARLPTGREANLLGVGSASIKAQGIGTVEAGPLALHGNVGGSTGGLDREFTYGGAATFSASQRASLSAELLGRWIPHASVTTFAAAAHPTLVGVETVRLASTPSGLHLLTVAPGVKWNLANTWMLVANASVPLARKGLTAPFTPFVGVEYTVAR